MFLGRKISRTKWDTQKEYTVADNLPADSFVDLRTTTNTLSFWKCRGTNGTQDELVLALVANAALDRLEKIDCFWMELTEFKELHLEQEETDGNTLVQDLVKDHVDLVNLDYAALGRLALSITTKLYQQSPVEKRLKEIKYEEDSIKNSDKPSFQERHNAERRKLRERVRYKRYSKAQVKAVLKTAIDQDRLAKDMLSDGLRRDLDR